MQTPLINILQLESVRKGTSGYKPRSAKPYTDVSLPGTKEVNPNFSDHATYVAQLWQANGCADLVANYYVCNLSDFDFSLAMPTRGIAPGTFGQVHIVIAPAGEGWQAVSNVSISKLQAWCEAHNALFIKSPPDLGQGFYQFPCQSVGNNILTVASSTTGSETAGMPPVDLYFPTDWNSYVQPSLLSTGGLLQLVDWILQNGLDYSPAQLRQLLNSDAGANSAGQKIFNAGAVLAALKSAHPSAPPQPLPPVVLPPAPPPVTQPPVAVPPPVTPAPVTTPALPTIARFDIGVSSAWSSPTQPTIFNIQTNGATIVTLTDPKGITKDVTGQAQVQVEGIYSNGSIWMLSAKNSAGATTKQFNYVHGCF